MTKITQNEGTTMLIFKADCVTGLDTGSRDCITFEGRLKPKSEIDITVCIDTGLQYLIEHAIVLSREDTYNLYAALEQHLFNGTGYCDVIEKFKC